MTNAIRPNWQVNLTVTGNGPAPDPNDVIAAAQSGLASNNIPSSVAQEQESNFTVGINAKGIDGSTVTPSDAASTIQTALEADPEWAGAALTVVVAQTD